MYDCFVYQVAGMDIREQQYICITLDLTVGSSLMLGCLGIDRQVKRQRAVYDTAGDLSFFTHLSQFCRIYGNGHLGIYNLNCC